MSTLSLRERSLALAPLVLALTYALAPPPPARAINPFAESRLDAEDRYALTGDVVSRLDAGSYVYFEIRDARGAHHWVATLAVTAPEHARHVAATILGRAHAFHSARLDRRFETLLFGIVTQERAHAP
ncbi:hypothetical protein [Sandaracinus amylolyticus]|uniref:Uncharacterized protein n=1 Tax=Sandaracinus amylolyticus TaxID=927083 RepID=A0A0F6YJU0_9BACT|nr:hypothetical protein [Sandaracinus amylolyticus]AKF08470.1 hypothetical protein DB32_005619 [Sandaracinus amylolyticus]